MTQSDKREMFRHNLATAVMNAHKYGMSWKHLHEELSKKTNGCWRQYTAGIELFPENEKHEINGRLINLDDISIAEINVDHSMNMGPRSVLVLTLRNGTRIDQKHGGGFDAFIALEKIKKATVL